MKLKIDDKIQTVEIIPSDHEYTVHVDKKRFKIKTDDSVKVSKVNENIYAINIDNDMFYVEVLGRSEEEELIINSPMHGVVQNVFVNSGQKVKKGQPILEIFAMKLQNEIVADKRMIVEQVFVKSGQTVEKGDLLVELKKVSTKR